MICVHYLVLIECQNDINILNILLLFSSSFISAGQVFQPHGHTSGGFRVGGGVHCPRQCGQLHIPVRTGGIFYFPWHRHQIEGTNGFYCLIRKTLAKQGKRNCQSSEEKSFYRSGTRTIGRRSMSLYNDSIIDVHRKAVMVKFIVTNY